MNELRPMNFSNYTHTKATLDGSNYLWMIHIHFGYKYAHSPSTTQQHTIFHLWTYTHLDSSTQNMGALESTFTPLKPI